MTQAPKLFVVRFIKKEKASLADAYSFYFEKNDFSHIPGNYIRLIIDKDYEDERGKWRYFSVAAAPSEKNIMVTTRIIKSPFKKELMKLVEGEEVKAFGPLGKFLFHEEDTSPRVFIAGGIGITPFRPMVIEAFNKKLTTPITLFASFSSVEEIVFKEDLEKIDQASDTIKNVITITHPEESKEWWNGQTGRLNKDMIQKYIQDIHEPMYMIAGPEGFVDALSTVVREMGVAEDKIITETFPGY